MDWPIVELASVADVQAGYGFPRRYQGRFDEEIPFFKVGDMNAPGNESEMCVASNTVSQEDLRSLRARSFPAGTVIFPKIGAAIATEKKRLLTTSATIDNNVMAVLPAAHLESRYLLYWFRTVKLQSIANIGPVPSIRKSAVQRLRIPLPPLSEQRRIVEILDQADRLRRLRAEADAKADRILPALFLKMFGDPATNPMGWPVKRLGQLSIHVTSGSRGWARYTGTGPARFLRTQDIVGGEISSNLLALDPPRGAEAERTRLQGGDVVVTITGIVGKAAAFRASERDVYVSQHVALVRPDPRQLTSDYLTSYANLPLGKVPVLARFQYGQTKPGLGFRELTNSLIPVPPIDMQTEFSKRLAGERAIQNARIVAEARLGRLWKALLMRAFTGDLTASWREAHIKELLQEMEQQAKALVEVTQ